MFLRNKNKIYVITAIIICFGALSIWLLSTPQQASVPPAIETVQIGSALIRAELATTETEQIKGLSGRISLASSTGMLFVFDYSSNWGIWMKDMNFPIDVLWIADDLQVADIVENMSPESYPKVYTPKMSSLYVLEVPAGTVNNYGISIGQDVVLK
jgi:uncharacterized membrane protein (UPF0127 family)